MLFRTGALKLVNGVYPSASLAVSIAEVIRRCEGIAGVYLEIRLRRRYSTTTGSLYFAVIGGSCESYDCPVGSAALRVADS